jgi:hypothetical protein
LNFNAIAMERGVSVAPRAPLRPRHPDEPTPLTTLVKKSYLKGITPKRGSLMRLSACRATTTVGLFFLATSVFAHPVDAIAKLDAELANEITSFRKELAAAATAKNAAALRTFYTEDFTHTHTSGKVDGRDARIVSLLAAEPTVEVAPTRDFGLSCFGDSVCIVRALSPIRRLSDGRWFDVRWTQTYVKTSHGWRIAVSQATGLPETIRDAL